MHVVGPPRRFRQQGVQVDVAGLGLGAVEMSLLAEVFDEPSATGVGVEFVVGDDVAHPGLLVVGVGAAERLHVDVLAGDAAHDVRTGHEDPALRSHDDNVGQRRPVGCAAGGEAHDDRNLRDVARGPDHGLENKAHRVQCPHTLGQSRTAGMPDPDDRALLLDSGVVGVDDMATTLDAHRAAHDGAVGAERDGPHALDGAGRGEHSGLVALVQQFDAVIVEEGAQPLQRVTGVERFTYCFRGHGRHPNLLAPAGASWSVLSERDSDVVPAESE